MVGECAGHFRFHACRGWLERVQHTPGARHVLVREDE